MAVTRNKSMRSVLDDPVTTLKGVGPALKSKLQNVRVETIEDLVFNVPRTYNDFSSITPIELIEPGDVTIRGSVSKISGRYVRRGLHITQATITDATGSLAVVWFNQPYRAQHMTAGDEYYMSGSYQFSNRRYVLSNPSCETVESDHKSTARIVPIYRETKGLKSAQLRAMTFTARSHIANVPDSLPPSVLSEHNLQPLALALQEVHFPSSSEALVAARYRLGFDEVFELSLAAQLNRADMASFNAPSLPFNAQKTKAFVARLGFDLTNAQRRVAWDILQDMEQSQPMNRLLEGDVGSGKTAVAAMAVDTCLHSGYQAAVMAPTSLLARQHLDSFKQLFPEGVTVELLVSSVPKKEKERIKADLKAGTVDIIIGTHALLQPDVVFKAFGLIVIDEQHRFGVKQRQQLMESGETLPHMLSMTATPIPRTLALTLYGEMDVSVIDEMPKGRLPVKTKIHSPNSTKQLYAHIDTEIAAGRQVFVVCPLIEESDTLGFKSVEAEYKRLKSSIFKHRRIAMLHGRMSAEEKDSIMEQFVNKNIDILLSTTVVEVGVNVPNASVMLIEGADRFGLAQLHQLRGRVGRSDQQAYCYLVPSTSKLPSERLRNLELTTDGFKLAELDLAARGPGAIYGSRQHGALDLRIAQLTDIELISRAQKAAKAFIASGEDLLHYPRLAKRVHILRAVTTLN